jgi:hypothetical protein
MPDASPAIVALDRDGLTLDCAAKTCSGDGLKTLQRWLGDGKAEVLLLHNGKGKPLVLVNWDTWNRVARTVVKGDVPDNPRHPGYDHSPLARAL